MGFGLYADVPFVGALVLLAMAVACRSDGGQGRIVYVTCPSVNECALVSIIPDGSDREVLQVLEVPEGEAPLLPQCSPDGKALVYFMTTGERTSIFSLALDDGEITELTPSLNAVDPAWSPDRRRIVFSATPPDQPAHPQLWVMGADGGDAHAITDNETFNLVPAWSPDGRKIAYTSESASVGNIADMWVVNADGSEPHPLMHGTSHDRQPAWSPDGDTLAFTRVEVSGNAIGAGGLGGQLFLADASGENVRPLTSGPPRKFLPRWSPDGKEVVFSTAPDIGESLGERDPRFQIYVVNSDGSHQRQVTDEPEGAHFATWCPSGH